LRTVSRAKLWQHDSGGSVDAVVGVFGGSPQCKGAA
jgi:hypothetical protein